MIIRSIETRMPSMTIYEAENDSFLTSKAPENCISEGQPSADNNNFNYRLDLNRELIKNPEKTFFARVNGHSLRNSNIFDGDILVIDRSVEPQHDKVAVCCIDGEFTVKRLHKVEDDLFLMPESSNFKPIKVEEGNDFQVWGVVTFVIHTMR
ncbi:LexA family protein [Xanthovirga aplysinae]|uniref:LexA family protein n=1 Tax=Xanthovirga aplysinae TaxID=2529853 RepID=UPI0012BBEAD3|nr:translesion error-prone DNA polymerase V autoproteolytic subunit [Xanthovirga aplysinae]MTI29749.1 translesion error-prone DNA polymerase V autoproteolytic subunit [Xanthovirga aplysinae]